MFDCKKNTDTQWYRGNPGRFVAQFRKLYSCRCGGLRNGKEPILDVYSYFLTCTLLPQAKISENIMKALCLAYKKETNKFSFSQMGLPLCRVCYCFLNGLSRAKLTTLIKKYRQKDKSCTRKEGSGRRTSPKMLSAQFWFKELIRMVGEPSPQSDLVYLPPAHKEDYYREYKDERIEAERVSRASFMKMWKRMFKYVQVFLVSNPGC